MDTIKAHDTSCTQAIPGEKPSEDVPEIYSTDKISRAHAEELIHSEPARAVYMYNDKLLLLFDDSNKFKILNIEDAKSTPFVLATSIRGFGKQSHYVYFIDPKDVNIPTVYKGYYSLKDCVKDKVLSLIDNLYPEVGIYDIDAKHIPLRCDENGKIVNAEESIDSPLIGLFQIQLAAGNFYVNSGIKLMKVVG